MCALPSREDTLLAVLDAHASNISTGAVSGHAIRTHLKQAGWDKRAIATTLGLLVAQDRIERVRVNEPSGLFYLAYRRK